MIEYGRIILLARVLALFTATISSPSVASQQRNLSFPNGFPDNFTSSPDAAIDVQYTSCKVITDRIVATAEGKFSRFCHGICNINETNAKLQRIETLLTVDAENIKHRMFQLERILLNSNNIRTQQVSNGDTERLREIGTYNGTIFSATSVDVGGADGGLRPTAASTFVYYWRVGAFWRLAFGEGHARSPPFYVSPRSYRVALTIHSDLTTRSVRVAVVPAAGEYDAQLRWPFAHRVRLSVLDQTDAAPEDIVSRVWDDVRCGGANCTPSSQQQQQQQQHFEDVCASMEFRHEVLTYRRYIAGDALLVKLTVFLQ